MRFIWLGCLSVLVCMMPGAIAAESVADLQKRLVSAATEEKPDLLREIGKSHYRAGEHKQAMAAYRQSLSLAEEQKNPVAVAKASNNIGVIHSDLGRHEEALHWFQKALAIDREVGTPADVAISLFNIADLHDRAGRLTEAMQGFEEVRRLSDLAADPGGVALSLNRLGGLLLDQQKYAEAMKLFEEALSIQQGAGTVAEAETHINMGVASRSMGQADEARSHYEKAFRILVAMGHLRRAAFCYHNLGGLYEEQGKWTEALAQHLQALKLRKATGDSLGMVYSNTGIARAQIHLGRLKEAEKVLEQGEALARALESKRARQVVLQGQIELCRARKNYRSAFVLFDEYKELGDAILNEKTGVTLARMRAHYETEHKDRQNAALRSEKELDGLRLEAEKAGRRSYSIIAVLAFLLVVLAFNRYRIKRKAHRELTHAHAVIREEKGKVEALIHNILPEKVARDLKEDGYTKPESFENVSVFFSDFVGFTELSSKLDPQRLIEELNALYTMFDAIAEKHGCERIKTIGDAYLCVCGMPEPHDDHAHRLLRAAREILTSLEERNRTSEIQWQARIGIHSGRVVGGVVGVKKYIYDVFGDTINVTARMESHCDPMRINVSEVTYELVRECFEFEARGAVDVKGRGPMAMYYLT